jgi:site-specific recombinase XerD
MEKFIQRFLSNLREKSYSEETYENYARELEAFRLFIEKTKKRDLKLLTPDDITAFKNHLFEKPLSAPSVNRALSTIRSLVVYLYSTGVSLRIRPSDIKLERLTKESKQLATAEQIERLIESPTEFEKRTPIVALRNRAMLEVLFATGMRISELVGLNRTQIDDSGKIFITGKGRKQRFVYLTPRATKHLTAYVAKRRDGHPALFVPMRGSNVATPASRISPNYFQMKIKQYRERLRINVPTSAHSLRHGFATYLAERGANPAALQILLGHESLETTTRYVHASDRYAAEAHRRFHPLSGSGD